MTYVIAEPCINTKDTACVDACPVDCIHPKKDDPKYATEPLLYIDPVECIDCGACVPVCPVSAIFALDDLPEKWNEFTVRNWSFPCQKGAPLPGRALFLCYCLCSVDGESSLASASACS
jgi:NAD-dependent dihydropyrimidine dehydrogenase PreA subunit